MQKVKMAAVVLAAIAGVAGMTPAIANPIVAGFNSNTLAGNDDGSGPATVPWFPGLKPWALCPCPSGAAFLGWTEGAESALTSSCPTTAARGSTTRGASRGETAPLGSPPSRRGSGRERGENSALRAAPAGPSTPATEAGEPGSTEG